MRTLILPLISTHPHSRTHVHIDMHQFTHTCTHMRTRTHTHTHTHTHIYTHTQNKPAWEGVLYWVFFRKCGSSKALVRWKAKSCIDRPRARRGGAVGASVLCVCVCVCWWGGRACGVSAWCRAASQARTKGPEGVRGEAEREGGGSGLSLWPRGSIVTPWPLSGECTARTHTETRMHAHTMPAPDCCCWWELSENETTWPRVRERGSGRESKTNTQNIFHPVILCYSSNLERSEIVQ